jgi:hypothetical protein
MSGTLNMSFGFGLKCFDKVVFAGKGNSSEPSGQNTEYGNLHIPKLFLSTVAHGIGR